MTITGGIVEDVQGIRIWAIDDDGHEILILIRYYR